MNMFNRLNCFILLLSVVSILLADEEIHLNPEPMTPYIRFSITGGYSMNWVRGDWVEYCDKGDAINGGIRFSVPKGFLFYKVEFFYVKLEGVENLTDIMLYNVIGGVEFVPFYRSRATPIAGIEFALSTVTRDGWETRVVSDFALGGGFEFYPVKQRLSFITAGYWHYNVMVPIDDNGNDIFDFGGLKYLEARVTLNYYIY
ncbi:MAG: hypothetical protein B6D57_02210 [Candidatus Coatesbacteria bacterium 4484_99]|uniref:Outer membrane protein beta-barrel domain-containing protein n=1 Tax=Candidatus Coatesbacteria bacterium 4484_99 TaxID=1970774 RepID=A0A1W9S212_9BACT|nr:MAG: hypothetical protein B6D57_02210 [Candidatus Coatesbacteria bacterium 4484_99]RLC42724.1 MAG: hypothetical protein DRH44_06070 [Candidatus Coatesbacteria bacterium]